MKRPDPMGFDDYRKYLGSWYAWMKAERPGFSYRAFSRMTAFKAPNQLLLVIQGGRNIAPDTIERYVRALGLGKREGRYFELLVRFNQADNMPEKESCYRELSAYWLRRGALLKPEQYRYFSRWHLIAVREMVNLADFDENPGWIARKLNGLITPAQAREALRDLLELGLLERDAAGRLRQTAEYVTTGDEIASVSAFLFHAQMMRMALESLKKKPSEERNITGLTFTIRRGDYETIVDMINRFRRQVVAVLENRPDKMKDERLYQLNLHLFPLEGD